MPLFELHFYFLVLQKKKKDFFLVIVFENITLCHYDKHPPHQKKRKEKNIIRNNL